MRRRVAVHFLSLGLALGACGEKAAEEPSSKGAKPVTLEVLKVAEPSRAVWHVGAVLPCREERIGFEVAGRMEFVMDLGADVEAPVLDGEGKVVREGTVLARLETIRHEQALESIEAEIASARARLAAENLELEEVTSIGIASAEAELAASGTDVTAAEESLRGDETERDLAKRLLEREENLLPGGGTTQEKVDEARARLTVAEARVTRGKAALEATRRAVDAQAAAVAKAKGVAKQRGAAIHATEVEIEELDVSARRAKRDLDDCVLVAPFTGRITKLHAARGAMVAAGDAVVTLSILDPVRVSIAVSADADQAIRPGDRAYIRTRSSVSGEAQATPQHAWVLDKAEVADSATRTFRVDLYARNVRRSLDASGESLAEKPTILDVMPVVARHVGEGGPLFAFVGCLLEENGETSVLRLPGLAIGPSRRPVEGRIHIPERIPVRVGKQFLTFLHFPFVELESAPGIAEGDMLVVAPSPEYLEGATVDRFEWAIRPGDLVLVSIEGGSVPGGFYVPEDAIREGEGESFVFLHGEGRVHRVGVTLHEEQNGRRRIEGAGLEAGAEIVVRGSHCLEDGDTVTLTSVWEKAR
ncbi:MAG: HlyD family efflux transporter periplasmic adaptor subunit [Planctomycetes bacterium]|nr:HlyD family efflux transporter periplasmic adaptor subunit [Planctomycetota bacterium]